VSLLGLLNRMVPDSRAKYALKAQAEKLFLRLTGKPRTKVLKDGVHVRYYPPLFIPDPFEDFELIGYEKHYQLRPGDVVIDGGGFVGLFTIFAAIKVGAAGRVIAYEPDPANLQLLERNIRLNGLQNVTVVRAGLWSCTTELKFDTRGNASNLDFNGTRGDVLVETVKVVSLDDEVERLRLSRLDFIKMNIEGAEIEAAAGCAKLMNRFPVNFAIAANHYRDGEQTAGRVLQTFQQAGYTAFTDYPQHLTVYARPAGPS